MVIIRFVRNVLAVTWLFIAGSIGSLIMLITFTNKWGMLFIKNVFAPILFIILRIKVKTTGIENLNKEKNYVFTSNHQSHLDTPAIYWKYPKILFFIAKQELRKAPVVGWFISLSGMLFVDRSNPEAAKASLDKAAQMINEGMNIISYPEGTRTKDGTIGQFKKGLFKMAIAAKTDVVPVCIVGAHEAWPSGTYKTKATTIHIHFGEPIPYSNYIDDAISFANDTRSVIESKMREISEAGSAMMG